MNRVKGARLSPAMIVAVMALIAAVAGTAVADPLATTSINKKKTKRIANQQANKQIDNRLPIGSEELGSIREETETVQIPANSTGNATANCTGQEKVISGGSKWDNFANGIFVITQQDQRSNNGWIAGGVNGTNQAQQFTVYAYCLSEED